VYRNVLVAIDQAGTSVRALAHATELARNLHARLTILCVVTDPPASVYGAGVDVAALDRDAERDAEALVRESAAEAPDDLSVTTIVRRGNPGEQIIAQYREGRHDLIVVGTRGRGRVASTMFGGVGAHIHFHLRVPLLVVPPCCDDDPPTPEK
jgi:nucleotide-binding universal stress UspA family protein